MSGLRKSVLKWIRIAGNHSGCHQMPDRSFFIKGRQVPVCARCTGVFVGQLSAALIAMLCIPFSFLNSLICLAVMGADWAVQEAGIRESTNTRRFLTGICGGLGLFSIYIAFIKKLIRFLFKIIK